MQAHNRRCIEIKTHEFRSDSDGSSARKEGCERTEEKPTQQPTDTPIIVVDQPTTSNIEQLVSKRIATPKVDKRKSKKVKKYLIIFFLCEIFFVNINYFVYFLLFFVFNQHFLYSINIF